MPHQPIQSALKTETAFAKPKVYSYARWSTEEQAKGDSQRRQLELAETWARANGYILDAKLSFRDEGVSAFRGKNTSGLHGLGLFLEACRNNLIEPHSVLLVESFDRLSRRPAWDTISDLRAITDAGVTLVTLTDGKQYSRESLSADPFAIMLAVMVASRAHEESLTKGRRVAAAWAAKRARVRGGSAERLTRRGPSWLAPAGDGWRENESKAPIVRRIFAMTIAGQGEHAIAKTLNAQGVPVLERGQRWHRSSVAKVLRNPAVIGTLIPGHIEHGPRGKQRVLEEPVPNAFPAVVSEADWLAVRAIKDGKTRAARGRYAGRAVAHVLAGLARCPACGSAMARVNKGNPAKGGLPKLVCASAKSGAGCRYVSVHVSVVEEAFLNHWGDLFANTPAGNADADLDRAFINLEGAIMGKEDHWADLRDALAQVPSVAASRSAAKIEAELRFLREELATLEERRRMTDRGLIHARLDGLGDILRAAEASEGELDRTAVNAALKVLFESVVVDYPSGRLRFRWRQGGETDIIYAWVDQGGPTLSAN